MKTAMLRDGRFTVHSIIRLLLIIGAVIYFAIDSITEPTENIMAAVRTLVMWT